MGDSLTLVWDERLAGYDFGPGHPLAPVRVELTMALARELGVLARPGVIGGDPRAGQRRCSNSCTTPATSPRCATRAGRAPNPVRARHPGQPGLRRDARGVRARRRRHWPRRARCGAARPGHAANVAGGLHHAMRRAASGFCVYNDPAIAIAWMLAQGAERIAYVDLDVHHGDGVQAAFYDDPRVLTISLHEHPRTLFPGTGLPSETGPAAGAGYAVNVALPAGTGDAGWLRAFDAVVPPLVREFRPQVLVSQHGCDSHRLDPLAHLGLSVDASGVAQPWCTSWRTRPRGGRWVLTGGGGYELVQVVPRSWTHLLAEAAGDPVDPAAPTPAAWRALAAGRTGQNAPGRMTDGAPDDYVPVSAGIVPGDPVDAAIVNTCRAVFAWHGLTPLIDADANERACWSGARLIPRQCCSQHHSCQLITGE